VARRWAKELIDEKDHSERSQIAEPLAHRGGCQHRAPAGGRESGPKGAVGEAAQAFAETEKRVLG
jgi:hypothetical protein